MTRYRWVAARRAEGFPTTTACEIAGVSPSAFYAWLDRPAAGPTARQRAEAELVAVIRAIHTEMDEVYGSPRMTVELADQGHHVNHKRVERLMRVNGIVGVHKPAKVRTTLSPETYPPLPDLVGRRFQPGAPDVAWAGDITYISTDEGWLYLASVLDLGSRRLLGYAMADHMRTELVVDALVMGIATRGGAVDGVIFHSDRGSQGEFRWSSQHLGLEVVGGHVQARASAGVEGDARGKIWSPGRPTTARREHRVVFWRAIARGLSSDDAAAEVGMSSAFGARSFREAGGMPPLKLVPVSGRYLSFEEREEIAILHAKRHGVRDIARRIGRSPSTISRELRRNASTRTAELQYRASTAQWHAERRASRPKVAKLVTNDRLRVYVQDRLAGEIERPDGTPVAGPDVRFIGRRHGRRADRRWGKAWSPEQISNRLRVDFPDDESMRISHEASYQSLYIQGRGALKRELVQCLRTGRALRVPYWSV